MSKICRFFSYFFQGEMHMALDLEEIRSLLDDLERETSEAADAAIDLAVKTQASVDAATAAQLSGEKAQRENAEKIDKLNEIIAKLQAAVAEG